MKHAFICLLFAMSSASVHAADNGDNGPADTAANFMGQLYGVKPAEVEVTIIERDRWLASAVTTSPGHPTCTLDMAQASEHVDAKHGWLIGGIACDKAKSTSQQ